jgi:hypothetical protein
VGAPKPRPAGSMDDVEERFGRLGVRRGDDPLAFLLALEEAVIAAWVVAHGGLRDMRLLQTATSILGCQGQHAVVLRAALGRTPVPGAFESGRADGVP